MVNLPDSVFEISRISLMMTNRLSALVFMMPIYFDCFRQVRTYETGLPFDYCIHWCPDFMTHILLETAV